MLFLFRERTSLRRWNPSKVAFMSCIFSNQMKNAYIEFKKDRKKFRVQGLLHQYGIGELPSHGWTRSVWDLNVNCMYVPLLVHGNHWISMCVNFVTRSIEVFDCAGLKHNKDLEPFAHLIPRIVKAVQSSEKRGFTVKPYDVTYAPMPFFLNKTSSDCGAYALNHIEAHLLGMDLTLVNDDNIREARRRLLMTYGKLLMILSLFREWKCLFLRRLQLLLRLRFYNAIFTMSCLPSRLLLKFLVTLIWLVTGIGLHLLWGIWIYYLALDLSLLFSIRFHTRQQTKAYMIWI